MLQLLVVLCSLVTLLLAAVIPFSKNRLEGDSDYEGEAGEYFEGDMMLSEAQMKEVMEAVDTRNGFAHTKYRWPHKTVVYHIETQYFDAVQLLKLRQAMDIIEQISCVKFRPRQGNEYAVVIKGSSKGCTATVGNNAHNSLIDDTVNLHPTCFENGATLLHEFLHTLGFHHMQSTYNRDDYVLVLEENIIPDERYNFAKYTRDTVTDFGVEYDYNSLMHYPRKAFSANGLDTIIPLQENVEIGQREYISERDILKLNRMYCM